MVSAKVALSALLNLTQKFTSDEPLEDILQCVTDTALRLLPATHSSIRILNDTHTELLCGARSGEGLSAKPMTFRPGEGVIGWVVEHGWVAYIQDTATDGRFVAPSHQGFAVGSMIAVPLVSAGKVMGVLSAAAAEPQAFSPEDEALTLLLGNCTVPIIDRARLERLAWVDELTGAYNDRYLLPRLRVEVDQAKRQGMPLSLLVLDLDHLKRVNDTHGFDKGDEILEQVGKRLRREAGARLRLVRRGGGTFVLLLPGSDEASALELADTLRHAMAVEPFLVGEDTTVEQTLSVGVASWDGEERALALLDRADSAMKEAKKSGRNQVALAPAKIESSLP